MQGSEYQRVFLFQLNSASANGLQFRSKENMNISLLLTSSFPSKPLKTTAHGLPKISRNLSSNGPTFDKSTKKVSFFQSLELNKVKWARKLQRLLLMLTFTWGRQINRCHVLNAMWTTSLTCAEVAGSMRTLPVGVHSARRLGCLRSLITSANPSGKAISVT